jgi:hypothetical protein
MNIEEGQEELESDDEYAFLKTSRQENLSTIRSSVYQNNDKTISHRSLKSKAHVSVKSVHSEALTNGGDQ